MDAKRDLISELPANVKHTVLECLPTLDAARIALLSTHWRDVWLEHGRLVFDFYFFRCVKKCAGDKPVDFVKIITYILLHRTQPVKKFTLYISYPFPSLEQSNLDQWFLFLSRNGVEELDISIFVPNYNYEYKLSSCIIWCRTIKKLALHGVVFDWPVNARCIFPALTSLVFNNVEFNGINGIVPSIPNLDKLAFMGCKGFSDFEISSPKLECLTAIGADYAVVESKWFTHYLKTIKTLCLSGDSLSGKDVEVAALTLPTAINLQAMKLFQLCFSHVNEFNVAMQLLKKSPNLCELDIVAANFTCSSYDIKATSKLLEDPNGCIVSQDLKMLNKVKIEFF